MKKLLFMTKDLKVRKVTRVDINRYLLSKVKREVPKIEKKEIFGASPPEVFVGRFGYPKVFVGPVIPPFYRGDTSQLGTPELWFGKDLSEIVKMRLLMVRTKKPHPVTGVEDRKILELHEMILSRNSVDTEVYLKHPPRGASLSFYHQPFGPAALLEDFRVSPGGTDFKLEKAYYDTDFGAISAMFYLYRSGVPISKIQQALSVGMLGVMPNRRLVPTRWSITAVDDTVSKKLLEKVRDLPLLDEYHVHYLEYLDNRWVIILFPRPWEYESIEVFMPGTLDEYYIAIGGDYEGFTGRKEYASIGGCYYSARLAVSEHLIRIGRQASALVLREAHPGYVVPVGVWNVRESVRNALRREPFKTDSMREVLEFISTKMDLPLKAWIQNSKMLKKYLYQETLERYMVSGSEKNRV